jgi:hypothetical protein
MENLISNVKDQSSKSPHPFPLPTGEREGVRG